MLEVVLAASSFHTLLLDLLTTCTIESPLASGTGTGKTVLVLKARELHFYWYLHKCKAEFKKKKKKEEAVKTYPRLKMKCKGKKCYLHITKAAHSELWF